MLVRVQAKDEYNSITEGNFTVTLLDIYEDLDGDQIEDHLDDDIDGDGYTNEEEIAYPSNPRNANSVATEFAFRGLDGYAISSSLVYPSPSISSSRWSSIWSPSRSS